jgi:hypothetical protein
MVAIFCPEIKVANLNRFEFFGHIRRNEAIIKMIRPVPVPVQIQCRMFFRALGLFVMQMVSAVNAFTFQHPHHIRMIADSGLPIPDRIAIEIPDQDRFVLEIKLS